MKKFFSNTVPYAILFLLCFVIISSLVQAEQKKDFGIWLKDLKERLKSQNISKTTINKYLTADLKPIPKIIELDRNQPEYKLSFKNYYRRYALIRKKAIKLLHTHKSKLLEIEKKYKVERKYIIALWASESKFGKNLGRYPAINALVTLAYDGRRAKFFEKELTILLKLIDQGKIKTKEQIKSSWAGALGHFQFMPSSYHDYGVDHNNNGTIDLWAELDDAFASGANYLSSHGWQYRKPCMTKVKLSRKLNLDKLISEKKKFTITKWQKLGVIPVSPSRKKNLTARLILLGKKNNLFLVYNNFDVIMKWNRAEHFAAAVCLFGNSLHIHHSDDF